MLAHITEFAEHRFGKIEQYRLYLENEEKRIQFSEYIIFAVKICNKLVCYPICSQCTISLPPGNIVNFTVFWCFQGSDKGCNGNKWPNIILGNYKSS